MISIFLLHLAEIKSFIFDPDMLKSLSSWETLNWVFFKKVIDKISCFIAYWFPIVSFEMLFIVVSLKIFGIAEGQVAAKHLENNNAQTPKIWFLSTFVIVPGFRTNVHRLVRRIQVFPCRQEGFQSCRYFLHIVWVRVIANASRLYIIQLNHF